MCALRKPPTSVVKIKPGTHAKLQEIAQAESRPMGDIVTDLVERYEKELFWKGVREDYARLRDNPAAWKDYQDEVAIWDATSGDGLESEPPFYKPEEEEEIRAEFARTYGG
ncbi:MAG: hypothetical protein ACR2OU_05960 [Thermomicrobiales bacterium]